MYLLPVFIIGIAIDLYVHPIQLNLEKLLQIPTEYRLVEANIVDGVLPLHTGQFYREEERFAREWCGADRILTLG